MKSMELALIGESMAGKSTFIASLFDEHIGGTLKSISVKNENGQTKVATWYNICTTEGMPLRVVGIGFSKDWTDCEEADNAIVKKICEFFDVEEREKAEVVEYLSSEEFQKEKLPLVDVTELLENIVNDGQIQETGLIDYIELAGSANRQVRKLMEAYKVENLKLRDTRGLMDETPNKMAEFLELTKEWTKGSEAYRTPKETQSDEKEAYVQMLLDDRGLKGIDACLFLSIANSNALNKNINREVYAPLLRKLLVNHPTFLIVRTDDCTTELANGATYSECCSKVLNKRRFSGFDSIRKLVKEYREVEKPEDMTTLLLNKHYKELLLANVAEDCWEEDEEFYRASVLGVLEETIKGVLEYQSDMEEAERFLKGIQGSHDEKILEFYNEMFAGDICCDGNGAYYSGAFRYWPKYMTGKISGDYYGGLVGVRGGLTTRSDRGYVGDVAVELLAVAYTYKERVYERLLDSLVPEIESYVENMLDMDNVTPEEKGEVVQRMKVKLQEHKNRELDATYEYLKTFGRRMIPKCYLCDAKNETCEDLVVTPGYIGKWLPELYELYRTPKWKEEDVYHLSVLKHITGKLMRSEVK